MRYLVNVNGKQFEVEIEKLVGGAQNLPKVAEVRTPIQPLRVVENLEQIESGKNVEVTSPMPGNIFKILVDVGQRVSEGETLVILEAMKMENEIVAPNDGVVKQILVSVGSNVGTDEVLVVMN